jgi:hypothetical protein
MAEAREQRHNPPMRYISRPSFDGSHLPVAKTTLPLPMPGFTHLFWNDRTIGFATRASVMAVLAGVGIPWATQPVPGAPVIPGPAIEQDIIRWVPFGATGIVLLLLVVLVMRCRFIQAALTHGTLIQGRVEEVDMHATEDSTDYLGKATYSRSYFATIGYEWEGTPRTLCQKLPTMPSALGVMKGSEVDLIVLASSPRKPLIKSIYTSR